MISYRKWAAPGIELFRPEIFGLSAFGEKFFPGQKLWVSRKATPASGAVPLSPMSDTNIGHKLHLNFFATYFGCLLHTLMALTQNNTFDPTR
jgi:hypothetical protein